MIGARWPFGGPCGLDFLGRDGLRQVGCTRCKCRLTPFRKARRLPTEPLAFDSDRLSTPWAGGVLRRPARQGRKVSGRSKAVGWSVLVRATRRSAALAPGGDRAAAQDSWTNRRGSVARRIAPSTDRRAVPRRFRPTAVPVRKISWTATESDNCALAASAARQRRACRSSSELGLPMYASNLSPFLERGHETICRGIRACLSLRASSSMPAGHRDERLGLKVSLLGPSSNVARDMSKAFATFTSVRIDAFRFAPSRSAR